MKSYGAALMVAAVAATTIIATLAESKAVRRHSRAVLLLELSLLAYLMATQ